MVSKGVEKQILLEEVSWLLKCADLKGAWTINMCGDEKCAELSICADMKSARNFKMRGDIKCAGIIKGAQLYSVRSCTCAQCQSMCVQFWNVGFGVKASLENGYPSRKQLVAQDDPQITINFATHWFCITSSLFWLVHYFDHHELQT